MNYGEPWCRDGISVRNLQLASPPHDGVDAWGRQKEQPVLLSVHLSFKAGFDSAASKDALDASTMHYGILSKGLRAVSSSGEWGDLAALTKRALSVIENTPPGRDILEHVTIEVKLPKASLLGDAVIFVSDFSFDGSESRQSNIIHLKDICIPTLIGVNSNERLAKQKLIINLWVGGIEDGEGNDYTKLEDRLTEYIKDTSYETLESLAVFVLEQLYKAYETTELPPKTYRLRLEKPLAVPWADAPAIEMFRTSKQLQALYPRPQ